MAVLDGLLAKKEDKSSVSSSSNTRKVGRFRMIKALLSFRLSLKLHLIRLVELICTCPLIPCQK